MTVVVKYDLYNYRYRLLDMEGAINLEKVVLDPEWEALGAQEKKTLLDPEWEPGSLSTGSLGSDPEFRISMTAGCYLFLSFLL